MQSRNEDNRARKTRGHGLDNFDRYWSKLVDGLAALGTVLIGALMLVICADIVFRNVFGSSLPLVSELGGLMLVMIVYLQLATTIRADRLAKTEIFLPLISDRFPFFGRALAALFDFAGASMLALIAWSTLRILKKDMASGEFIGIPGIATTQTWPFQVLILIGVSVAALEFVLRAISGFRSKPSSEKDAQ